MPANAFISYDHEDQSQVAGFKLLKNNPKHPLDFHDHSLKGAVRDRSGKPNKYPPSSDARSKPVRDEIRRKFDRASKLVVLIGDNTHDSEWVDWEINTFYEMKEDVSGQNTWNRRGMTLKGSDETTIPSALYNGRSTQWLAWNPEALDKWLDTES